MAQSSPQNLLTFLFTDIEGSTARWEANQADMSAAVQRHDALTVAAIEQAGGRIFKTTGDGTHAVFAEPAAAVAAALDLRDRLRREDWPSSIAPIRVRAGIHTGPAESRAGDYFGPTLNRTARLMDAGHGDQILLSEAAQHLMPPHSREVRLLGSYRLRDLLRPERIYQVGGETECHAPLRVLNERVHNLPVQVTSFVGRRAELSDLVERIRTHRLVTLTGPGGTGKTRLALQAAAELTDAFDSVCFVSLASISQVDGVAPAVADALGLHDRSSEPILEVLTRYLTDRADMLVLDNFEHLIDSAGLVGDLLTASTRLHVVVTSRELLRLRAEHQFPVAPLDLPKTRPGASVEEFSQSEAVRLFAERARAVRPDFHVHPSNADDIVAICGRLDGLPLAIELAAARVRLFAPGRLRAQLESGDANLGTGPVDAPRRQRTLSETISWSYDLLSEDERAVFRRLAVFIGGRSIEAVERVCLDGLRIDGAAAVEALADKSLVRVNDARSGEPRLDLLETLHAFAREKLADSGELEQMRSKHARYFADLVGEAEAELRGPGQVVWVRRLEDERPNLDAAMSWSFDSGEKTCGLRIVAGLRDFWFYQGHGREMGRATLRALDHLDGCEPTLRAGVLLAAGFHAYAHHEPRTCDLLDEAAALYASSGDRAHHALAQVWAAGSRQMFTGNLEETRRGIRRGLELARDAGAEAVVAQALNHLGELERIVGNYELARDIQTEGLALSRHTGEVRRVAMMTQNLGWIAHHLGDSAAAERLLRESLALAIEHEFTLTAADALVGLGEQRAHRGDPETAAQLMGFAENQYARTGARVQLADDIEYDRIRRLLSEQLEPETYRLAVARGAQLGLSDAVALVQ